MPPTSRCPTLMDGCSGSAPCGARRWCWSPGRHGDTAARRRTLGLERQLLVEDEKYVAAVRDWAEHGAASRYVLTPEEVLARSRPRGRAEALQVPGLELRQVQFSGCS